MRIVIEGYPYEEDKLKQILPPRLLDFPNKKREIRPPYVGYCFNPEINDCIFFLPKVVLTKDKNDINDTTGKGLVLNRYSPTDLLDFENLKLEGADRSFLQMFSIWIYRAINIFYKNNDTSIVSRHTISDVDSTARTKNGTIIDTILSLLRFARENKAYVMFEIKNIHRGYNRVNWNKTISHQTPIRQKKTPIYLNPINKKKQIDFDEELLVIFFSILEYINRQYGFSADINCNYETIRGSRFEHYLNGFGKIRLRQIKNKYFSDTALKLWSLCYSFFENSDRIHSSGKAEDFLIAQNFETVFESIIDTLLGEKVPAGFKTQKDGKIIDHIYPYEALVNPDSKVYHIADSKYYKAGSAIGSESIYKQFTYAKNVIQLTLDIVYGKGTDEEKRRRGYLPYRDTLTEGYNTTPNFFISAKIKKDNSPEPYSYTSDNLEPHDVDKDGQPLLRHRIIQFENRLFDRDTLILSHYDINFLYLIALYGKDNSAEQESFRNRARKVFRESFIRLIDRYYIFYKVIPEHQSPEEFVHTNFRELSGKLFHFGDTLIMGLERSHPETKRIEEKYSANLRPYSLS